MNALNVGKSTKWVDTATAIINNSSQKSVFCPYTGVIDTDDAGDYGTILVVRTRNGVAKHLENLFWPSFGGLGWV
ncbi:hypothetical protein VB10N_11680 [Vibrio sp. 10N]|nr:hypothetical protein VB10N_11680 [Vibrio sp. 10N]